MSILDGRADSRGNVPTQEINLRVGEVRMTLDIPRSTTEEELYRNAATLVNRTIERYRTAFEGLPKVELLSYVALDVAYRLQHQGQEHQGLELEKRLSKLNKALEETL